MRNLKFFCGTVLMVTLLAGCSGGYVSPDDGTTVVVNEFGLKDEKGILHDAFLITNGNIHIKVPNQANLHKMILVFRHNGSKVLLPDGKELISDQSTIDCDDFTKPVTFDIETQDGRKRKYTILIHELPVLMLETANGDPIESKTERTPCEVSLVEEGNEIDTLGYAGIRGRGNSTWKEASQKPYNLKFKQKQRLLGMKKSKNWILVANTYFDRTQLHNAVAYEMALQTNYPWVQAGEYVEMIINGEYRGLYYLCEKIEAKKGKIAFEEMGSKPDDPLYGGYLLETIEYPTDEDVCFKTDYFNTTASDFSYTIYWEAKTPKHKTEEQWRRIQDEVNHMESLIADEDSLLSGAYRKCFDIESAINWLLVEEVTMNKEATGSKNVFLYKTEDNIFHVGPPWDFDAWTFGDREAYSANVYKSALYYHQLLKDPFFIARLQEMWNEYKETWRKQIPGFVDNKYHKIHRTALRTDRMYSNWYKDHQPKWYSIHRYSWQKEYKGYDELIVDLKKIILNRLEKMDSEITNLNKNKRIDEESGCIIDSE